MHECVYMYTPKFLITYLSKANNAAFSFVQLAFGGKGLSQCVKLKSGFVFLPTFLIGGFLLLLTPFSYHKCWDTSEHFQKDPFLGDDAFLYVPLVCPNVGNRISILNIHHQTNTQKRGVNPRCTNPMILCSKSKAFLRYFHKFILSLLSFHSNLFIYIMKCILCLKDNFKHVIFTSN